MFGFNKRVNIIRETSTDDVYGGSVVNSSVIYYDQFCRIDHYMPRMGLVLPQGLETGKGYTLTLHYNWQNPVDLRENDIVQIVFPPHDHDYNKRYRIFGVSYESSHPSDPKGLMECYMYRIERDRGVNSF